MNAQSDASALQRWAIIGAGRISRSIVSDLASCSGAEAAVVQSRDPDKAAKFAAEFGVPRSTGDIEEVLADESIDAVYIATPIATHHELARRALLAGKHVLVEKPMAMNTAEVEDLFRVAQEQRRFLMEAMWTKFSPAFRRLRSEVAAGTIGEVRSIRAGFSVPVPDDGGSKWDPARSGGALRDQGIYPVTMAHAFLGVPNAVHVSGAVREDGLDLDQHFTLEFTGGRFAQCTSAITEFSDLSAAVNGIKGWITLPSPFWSTTSLEIHAGDLKRIFLEPERVNLPREGNGYIPMLREVIAAIGEGRVEHPVHPAEDTIAVFRTLDTIRAKLERPLVEGSELI